MQQQKTFPCENNGRYCKKVVLMVSLLNVIAIARSAAEVLFVKKWVRIVCLVLVILMAFGSFLGIFLSALM